VLSIEGSAPIATSERSTASKREKRRFVVEPVRAVSRGFDEFEDVGEPGFLSAIGEHHMRILAEIELELFRQLLECSVVKGSGREGAVVDRKNGPRFCSFWAPSRYWGR